ncbi:ankyrin, partial [Acephala macrosclerotiorum]
MDPVSIVGLVGTCLAISGKIVSITAGLQQIVGAFKKADKDIKRISNQLDVFNATIEQLRIWLDRNRSLSSSFRKTISTAFEHCDVIVSDIEEQVQAVQPEPGQSKSSFSRKLKHLWNDNIIKEYERMISNQFIAFTTVIQVVHLNELTEPDKLKRLQTKSTKQLFATAAEDAKSITESKSTASRIGDYTSDNGENLSMEFSIDKEITRSKPYVKHYRTLVHAQFRSGRPKFNTISEDLTAEESESNVKVSTAPTTHTPQSAQGPPTPPVSQGRRYTSEALQIWDLYREETRIKVAKLCAAARRGDLDNVRSLIESGAIIDAHDEEGDTPLLCAIEFCHFEIALFLLDAGASNFTPLHLAAYGAECKVTTQLINHHASVSAQDSDGATPLMIAVAYNNVCAVQMNLEAGAPVNLKDNDGFT